MLSFLNKFIELKVELKVVYRFVCRSLPRVRESLITIIHLSQFHSFQAENN